jgi:acid stress-induced BolA-like protein IbaG/YrbA
MTTDEIQRVIEAGVPECQAAVTGDDGVHFEAIVISPAFAGLNPVKRHQLVYQALGDLMKGAVHALSIRTYTPEQWQSERDLRVL